MKRIKIHSKEQARDYAIAWQHWFAETSMSYAEIVDWQAYFYKLAQKYNLMQEFRENGII